MACLDQALILFCLATAYMNVGLENRGYTPISQFEIYMEICIS
jgi:hypothetical protein